MKKLLIFIGLLTTQAFALEQADLNPPMVEDPRSSDHVTVDTLLLDRIRQRVVITVGQNGIERDFLYEGSTATLMMNGLNTANLSVNSLHRRVLQRLINDGYLTGTISGTPD